MHRWSLLAALLPVASVLCASDTASSYLASESPIAHVKLLNNVGPAGSSDEGAFPGVVVAAPSTDPDYIFTWTRDSSLVFKTLIDQYTLGINTSSSIRTLIDNFVSAETTIQQVSNPSGTVSTGGLGEPKFYVNETAFTGPWGRPQRDGPALRATAIMTYANWLIANGNTSHVTSALWPMLQLDLNYVSSDWNMTTFDLWEELDSSSFWTSLVQHRALRQGAALATTLGNSNLASTWTTQAQNVLCFVQSYWNSAGFMTANTGGGRSGIDANTVLASIHTFDPAAGCDAVTFQPCSDVALLNLLTYVNSFRSIYTINSGIASNEAVATGRYPEDVYQGGNPWYLNTLAAAEQLYDALYVWQKAASISVTSLSQPFFALFVPGIATGTYASSTTTYSTLISDIQAYADGFVSIVAEYTPSGGALSEQYSRSNGSPLSANDLTWSYASVLTAAMARAGTPSASWGASGLTVSDSCYTNSRVAPVEVTFNVDATTVFGENIFLTGSLPSLYDWSTTNPIPLSAANYPIWSATVMLPANTAIQYKYIRIESDGSIEWESDPNMALTTPGSGTFVTNDTWR